MAKNRKSFTRTKRTPRSNARRRRGSARLTATPPLLPFNRKAVNSTFRSAITQSISNNSFLTLSFYTKTLVEGYPHVFESFKEMKVVRVKIWAYTTLPTSASGIITMITSPADLSQKKTTATLAAAAPGAITRKIYQPLRGVWFPTEPSERDWFPIGNDSTKDKLLFTVQFFPSNLPKTDSTTAAHGLTLIIDAHVQLRGQINGVTGTDPLAVNTLYDDVPALHHMDT